MSNNSTYSDALGEVPRRAPQTYARTATARRRVSRSAAMLGVLDRDLAAARCAVLYR